MYFKETLNAKWPFCKEGYPPAVGSFLGANDTLCSLLIGNELEVMFDIIDELFSQSLSS